MLGAIVGFAMPIQRVHGIHKLSQNKHARDFSGVQAGLQQSSWPTEQRLAVFMADLPTH
jgi:transcriptional regulator